jgi:cytochrome c oxidase assembly protein subunit 15
VLVAIELSQGLIGFVQYFTDLPIVLVEFHLLGATLVASTLTWVLLQVRAASFDR